jgi:hypothetical protein
MRDRWLIYCGLTLFVAVVTFPVWQGIAAQTTSKGPDVKVVAGRKTCVAPREYMRAAHMELLMNWRDARVRDQQRRYTAYDGTQYTISLTKTCLNQCHGSRDTFCDRCHSYAGVTAPSCWNCHTSPPPEPHAISTATAGGVR